MSHRTSTGILAALASAAITAGCSTTYTEADMHELEAAEERSEDVVGENAESMILDEERVIHETDR